MKMRKYLVISGLLIILPVAAVLLFLPIEPLTRGRLADFLHDFLHVPLFGGFTYLLLRIAGKPDRAGLRAGLLTGVMILLSVLVEMAQPFTGREGGLRDVLLGAAGCLAALMLYMSVRGASARTRRTSAAAAAVLVLVAGSPALMYSWDHMAAIRAFPELASFENKLEMTRWLSKGCEAAIVRDHVTADRHALKIEVGHTSEMYPGVFLAEGPRDWSGYDELVLDVYAPGTWRTPLWVRIDDRPDDPPYDDRGQMAVSLSGGAQEIVLDLRTLAASPGGRPLRLDRIVTLGLFWENQGLRRLGMFWRLEGHADTLYLDNIRLRQRVASPR